MMVCDFTQMTDRFVKRSEAPNDQSKDELLTPNIDKVVVLQRLLVGYRGFVLTKGWV